MRTQHRIARRRRIEQALRENGIGEHEGDIHNWRCAYPNEVGQWCECFASLVDDLEHAIEGETT